MLKAIKGVDICCGLAWGDEAKGKIVSQLSKNGDYDFVCRWSGGNNAGHTVFVDGEKYKTHLIPSGIFFGIKSIIGPGCVVNIKAFEKEIKYLISNIKILSIEDQQEYIGIPNVYPNYNISFKRDVEYKFYIKNNELMIIDTPIVYLYCKYDKVLWDFILEKLLK